MDPGTFPVREREQGFEVVRQAGQHKAAVAVSVLGVMPCHLLFDRLEHQLRPIGHAPYRACKTFKTRARGSVTEHRSAYMRAVATRKIRRSVVVSDITGRLPESGSHRIAFYRCHPPREIRMNGLGVAIVEPGVAHTDDLSGTAQAQPRRVAEH